MLLPLAATGCSVFDDWFGDKKTPLPGKRQSVMPVARGLQVDNPASRAVTVPAPVANAEWLQAGGAAGHAMGNLAAGNNLAAGWTASIGTGGGYRRKLTARPVVGGGRVFAMDSDGTVSALDVKSGGRIWQMATVPPDVDTTNVGGGIALDGGILYAATGFAEVVALDAATGKVKWRKKLPTAARAAPTLADGRLFVPTLDAQLVALSASDGARLWAHQAVSADTALLGLPSPAYADGLVVAGFGSGELVCLRANSGTISWTDSLAAVRGRTALVDLSAIRGMPVIADGRVYAIGLGALLVCIDLRTGRRLWERDVASTETPWLAGDWLYVLTDDQALTAINREDGAVAWVTQLPRWENEEKQQDPVVWAGPVLAGGRLLVASTTQEIRALDPVTGKLLQTQPLSEKAALAPVVAGGTVFQLRDNGSLLALR